MRKFVMHLRSFEKNLLVIIFGVLLGFFVALVLSYFLFPLTGQVDPKFMATVVDTHNSIHSELREANFYRLCVVFGFGFGFLGLYGQRFIKAYVPIVVGILALVSALNWATMTMIKSISPGEFYTQNDELAGSLVTALLSTLPFILIFLTAAIFAVKGFKKEKDDVAAPEPQPVLPSNVMRVFPSWGKYVIVLLCLMAVFAPRSTVSERLGLFDYHRPTFFVGPGLYQLSQERLAPGKDFSVQYGLAQSFVSALFFADTYPRTIANINIYNAWVKFFFFFCLFIFLRRFYQNTFAASVVLVSAVALQFLTYEEPGGLFYEATLGVPSVGVYRHAFVPLAWIFALNYLQKPGQMLSTALLCLSLGLSLFWINDTGIACLVCVLGVVILTPGRAWHKNLGDAAVIVFFSVLAFAALGSVVYGASFMKVDYSEMIKYMRIFASGYASVKVHWSFTPLHLFMNICSNVIVVGTIVFAFKDRGNIFYRGLLMIAVFAAMVKLKFINQTASQHFFGDGYVLLIVLGFWFSRSVLQRCGNKTCWKVIVLGGILFLIYDPSEKDRGIHAGIRSYLNSTQTFQLPHLLHSPGQFFSGLFLPRSTDPMFAFSMPQADRALIEQHTKAGTRVFLISADDTAYLVETKRAPGAPFVPMADFMFVKNFDDFYNNALKEKFIFVDFRSLNSTLASALLSRFAIKERAQYLLLLENETLGKAHFTQSDLRDNTAKNAVFLKEMLMTMGKK